MAASSAPRTGLGALRPPAFGAEPAGERLARIHRSPHFANGVFQNPGGPARVRPSGSGRDMAKQFLDKDSRSRRAPRGTIPVHPTTLADLNRPPATGLRLTWMGHSSVLAEIDGQRVLFDPVWGERCSPFPFAGPKRLHPVPLPLSALGPVDVVVISHDHYDHLDLDTVRALTRLQSAPFVVPLGVGAHLRVWGVPEERIVELDWHQRTSVGPLTITATPAQHFSGRAFTRNTTLWASWVLAGPRWRVFYSGDTGYCDAFADIGRDHGPFDLTLVQIGAYASGWPDIHMTPEEGVATHRDVRGGLLVPVHWGTFNLAPHGWADPVERVVRAAEEHDVRVVVPRPGERVDVAAAATRPAVRPWWRALAPREDEEREAPSHAG